MDSLTLKCLYRVVFSDLNVFEGFNGIEIDAEALDQNRLFCVKSNTKKVA